MEWAKENSVAKSVVHLNGFISGKQLDQLAKMVIAKEPFDFKISKKCTNEPENSKNNSEN